MAGSCCLCLEALRTDHRRSKKLHGASCGTARAVLRGLLDYPLESLLVTRDPAALLCCSCEKTLNSINSISKKLENMKADVRAKGSALRKVQQCGQKRPRSLPDLEVPTQYQQFTAISTPRSISTQPSNNDTETLPLHETPSNCPSTDEATVEETSPQIQVHTYRFDR